MSDKLTLNYPELTPSSTNLSAFFFKIVVLFGFKLIQMPPSMLSNSFFLKTIPALPKPLFSFILVQLNRVSRGNRSGTFVADSPQRLIKRTFLPVEFEKCRRNSLYGIFRTFCQISRVCLKSLISGFHNQILKETFVFVGFRILPLLAFDL